MGSDIPANTLPVWNERDKDRIKWRKAVRLLGFYRIGPQSNPMQICYSLRQGKKDYEGDSEIIRSAPVFACQILGRRPTLPLDKVLGKEFWPTGVPVGWWDRCDPSLPSRVLRAGPLPWLLRKAEHEVKEDYNWTLVSIKFVLVGFKLFFDLSLLSSLLFLPFGMRMSIPFLSRRVFWKHIICLIPQVQAGILP